MTSRRFLWTRWRKTNPILELTIKKELYDALVKSYNTDKDLFDTYGEVFTLKRGRDNKDKDQDPSDGSGRGTKSRKSSNKAESFKDPRSKKSKSSSSSKGTSRSHHKSSGKSAHAEEPSHIFDDSRVRHNQEFVMSNNDEQPDDEVAPKGDWYKKPERPPTLDPDWDKRQPFVLNRLKIPNLTQEILVGPAFNILKGTYHRGLKVIPQDYFINNDLEYLKCGSLSRKYSTSVTKTIMESRKGVTRLTIMKWYKYSHLDKIEVRREDQQQYTFKEALVLRTASAAAKLCQGDSFEFYLIIGIPDGGSS
ncbi:hypothetical protein Tco_1369207 [Tanacetum coccineum]